MATITQYIQTFYLSCQLPEEFYIRTSDDAVEVAINVGSEEYFNTILYAYNGTAHLYDIRSIVEQALFEDGNQMNYVTITATDSNSTASVNFDVLFCDININTENGFLDKHFLTTRQTFTINRNGFQHIYWVQRNGGVYPRRIDAVIRNEETTYAITVSQTTINATMDDVNSETIRPSDILSLIENQYPQYTDAELLTFTIHRGGHNITFYVTDETPDIILSFCNAFNAMEILELYAVTHRKQNISQTEAKVMNNLIQYNRETEHIYEVETAALNQDEAIQIEQLLRSPYIEIIHSDETHNTIIITDSTSEISDSDNEQNRIKFSYRYTNNTIPFIQQNSPQVFTQDFQPPFQ